MALRLSDITNAELQKHQTTDLMRVLSARAFSPANPAEYFRERWPRALHVDVVTKHFEAAPYEAPEQRAAVAAGTTTDTTWAAPLMVPSLLAGFLPLVRAASLLGRLPVTPAPFNTKLAKQTAGSSTTWVGENTMKPVSKLAFGNVLLPWAKCSSIIVVTAELLKLAVPGTAEQLQQTIRDEVTVFVDKEFLGTAAAVANERPAGILNGVTPVTASADLAADLKTLIGTFFAARPSPLAPAVIVSPAVASKIAALPIGHDVTTAGGGTLYGLPVYVSPAAGANAIVTDAAGIYVADGGLDLDISKEALLAMDDAPGVPAATTVMVSLWPNNLVGIRCERFITWVVAVANSIQYLVVA